MKKVMVVVGTRPEAIKLVPLYIALKEAKNHTTLCATQQHQELLGQVLDIFNVVPDVSLNIMQEDQNLFDITSRVLLQMQKTYKKYTPDIVIVQGDTTTAAFASIAAFYLNIPVVHVEAGLRTYNMQAPFPEEFNRRLISLIASCHCAPTQLSVNNLISEGIDKNRIFLTGNTIVDALLYFREKIINKEIRISLDLLNKTEEIRKRYSQLVLLTAHRRESFDGGLLKIFKGVSDFLYKHPDVYFFYPVHPNPNVIKAIEESEIKNLKNIFLMTPVDYKDLIYLLMSVDWVMTDSGGIQEEAATLGKRVIILREFTERSECICEGKGMLVGTDQEKIKFSMEEIYNSSKNVTNEICYLYGDGQAVPKIVSILTRLFLQKDSKYSCKQGEVL